MINYNSNMMHQDQFRKVESYSPKSSSPRGARSPVVTRQDSSSGTLKTTISLGKNPSIVHSGPFYLMKEPPGNLCAINVWQFIVFPFDLFRMCVCVSVCTCMLELAGAPFYYVGIYVSEIVFNWYMAPLMFPLCFSLCWKSVVLGESELTGATNLMAYYGLEHSYSKFSGKKVKEQLSSFLPSLPGVIDGPGQSVSVNILPERTTLLSKWVSIMIFFTG